MPGRFLLSPRIMLPLFAVVLTIAACSDDESPTGGGNPDTSPPAVSSVTPIDVNHVEVTFGENIQRTSAEDAGNYTIVEAIPLAALGVSAAPGDTLYIAAVSLKSDQRTVSITTLMNAVPYDISIAGVKDASGNTIQTPVVSSFTGTTDPDETAPEIVYRSPGPNATGVPVSTSILIVFTEQITYDSFVGGTTLTSEAGSVLYGADSDDGGVHVVVTTFDPLDLATKYTLALSGVQDVAGNALPTTSWSFTTTSTPDQTPPTVISSNPADLATNVDLGTDISITFSEPMDQSTFIGDFEISPPVGFSDFEWLDGTTVRLYLYEPLSADQQYTFTVFPDGWYDLAGNPLVNPVSIRFTTGNTLARGSIAGTLTGDSQSDYAKDPTGAFVLVLTPNYDLAGTDVAAGNNSYSIQHLPDGYYLVAAIMDSNGDGMLSTSDGDAFGIFGTNPRTGDYDEDVVTINGGNRVTGVNFGLFDASVISGEVWYPYAEESHEIVVGLFRTNNPLSEPDYTFSTYWYGNYIDFWFDSFDGGPSSGTFYIGAYLDANDSGSYEPIEDPAAFYGDPTDAITVKGGSDMNDISIYLEDPLPGSPAAAASVAWPLAKASKRSELLKRLSDVVRKGGHSPGGVSSKQAFSIESGVRSQRPANQFPYTGTKYHSSKSSPAMESWTSSSQ